MAMQMGELVVAWHLWTCRAQSGGVLLGTGHRAQAAQGSLGMSPGRTVVHMEAGRQ